LEKSDCESSQRGEVSDQALCKTTNELSEALNCTDVSILWSLNPQGLSVECSSGDRDVVLDFSSFYFYMTSFSFLSFLNLSCFSDTNSFILPICYEVFFGLAKFLFHSNNAVQRLPEYGHQDNFFSIQAIKTIK